jgi:hypothetical protein
VRKKSRATLGASAKEPINLAEVPRRHVLFANCRPGPEAAVRERRRLVIATQIFSPRVRKDVGFNHPLRGVTAGTGRTATVLMNADAEPAAGAARPRVVDVPSDGAFHCPGRAGVCVVDGSGVTHSNIAEAKPDRAQSIYDVRMHVLSAGDRFNLDNRRPAEVPSVERSHQLATGAENDPRKPKDTSPI